MLREILTLVVDKQPTQYYIQFGKDRKRFHFKPTLKNKYAPSFVIHVQDGNLLGEGSPPETVFVQAKEKVREILSNNIFDQF